MCGLLIPVTFSHKEDVLLQKAGRVGTQRSVFVFCFPADSCLLAILCTYIVFDVEEMLVYVLLMNVNTALEDIHLAAVYDF